MERLEEEASAEDHDSAEADPAVEKAVAEDSAAMKTDHVSAVIAAVDHVSVIDAADKAETDVAVLCSKRDNSLFYFIYFLQKIFKYV